MQTRDWLLIFKGKVNPDQHSPSGQCPLDSSREACSAGSGIAAASLKPHTLDGKRDPLANLKKRTGMRIIFDGAHAMAKLVLSPESAIPRNDPAKSAGMPIRAMCETDELTK